MHWLILVENQDKAQAIRKLVPQATTISTKGTPWDIEIELSRGSIQYQVRVKEKFKDFVRRLETTAASHDKVLLAFDQTSLGEACAREFERLLGREKCTRWLPNEMTKKSLNEIITRGESSQGLQPHSSSAIAQSHWCQAVTDIVWTNKVSRFLSQELEQDIKITRTMAAMLKLLAETERSIKSIKEKNIKYWELEVELKKPNGQGEILDAKVIVPTLAQIESAGGSVTKEIWRRKLKEAKEQSIKGAEVPQPEPGKSWRFQTYQEALCLKRHIEKFPYFFVENIVEYQKLQPIEPPLTYYTLNEQAAKHGKKPRKDIDDALWFLYLQGAITNPKTLLPNLSQQCINNLYKFGQKKGWQIEREKREFVAEDFDAPRWEALRPTNWELMPSDINELEGYRFLKNKVLVNWLYNLIYIKARNSQVKETHTVERRHFLSGPLCVTRKDAIIKEGKPFTIQKEQELQAHMTILLSNTDPSNWEDIPQEYILEASDIFIRERKVWTEEEINQSHLIELLASEKIGRLETLEQIASHLKAQSIVEGQQNIKLTPKGWRVIEKLENTMGEYIDLNYHRCLSEVFHKIEIGLKEGKPFLEQWWENFQIILEESIIRGQKEEKNKLLKKSA